MNPYDDTADKVVATFGRIHGNGEQTHVAVLSRGQNAYVAVAYDIDPGDYEPVAAAAIAHDPTLEGVEARAKRWMEQNPKGVAPEGGGADGGPGLLRRIVAKLLDFGERRAEKLEQQHGEKQ